MTLGGNNYKDVLKLMSKKVEENGGNVIKTIAITKSGGKTGSDIQNEINNMDIA